MTVDTPRLEIAIPRLGFPHLLTRGAIAKAITEVAVRPMPIRMRYPDGDRGGRRCSGRPRARGRPAAGALPPARVAPEDRSRRGLHGRRLEGRRRHRPRAGAHALRGPDGPDRAEAAAVAARPRRPGHPAAPAATPSRARGATSARTTTSRTTCSARSSTRRCRTARPCSTRRGRSREQDLHEAQVRKVEAILDAADVGEGTRVLEIGTGWGELSIRAAARGARRHLGHPVRRAARPRPRADRGGRVRRPRPRCCSRTTARRPGSSTPSSASR